MVLTFEVRKPQIAPNFTTAECHQLKKHSGRDVSLQFEAAVPDTDADKVANPSLQKREDAQHRSKLLSEHSEWSWWFLKVSGRYERNMERLELYFGQNLPNEFDLWRSAPPISETKFAREVHTSLQRQWSWMPTVCSRWVSEVHPRQPSKLCGNLDRTHFSCMKNLCFFVFFFFFIIIIFYLILR